MPVAPRRDLTWKERLARCVSYLSPMLLQGVPMTLLISLLGMALAMALGLVGGADQPLCRAPARTARPRIYVELFRGTPLLIQLYSDLLWSSQTSESVSRHWRRRCIGLGLNYAACEAENYRAGILAIPSGPDRGGALAWPDPKLRRCGT
jgi:polar amino acid transport system substrate-binding protein